MITPATAVAVSPERDSHQEVTGTASDDLSKPSRQALPFFNQGSLAKLGERGTQSAHRASFWTAVAGG